MNTALYLVQTDTTVGFLSRSTSRLTQAKQRNPKQPFLVAVDSFMTLSSHVRVPKVHRKRVRNSVKTTFIYPNKNSYRVVSDERHLSFIKQHASIYSTSANLTEKGFEEGYACANADVIVYEKGGFFEDIPSGIYKLSKRKKLRLR